MPQYVPGNEQILGPAFAQIAEGLVNVLNPKKRFQDAVLGAISRDPSLIQKFADFEASSPGILQQLGIPALGGVKPSVEAEFEAKNRALIQAGKEHALTADVEANKLKTQRLQSAMRLLEKRPDLDLDAAMQLLTGETTAERTIKGEEAKQAPVKTELLGTQADVAKTVAPLQKKQAEFALKGYAVAENMLANGPEVTLEKFMSGEFTNEQLMAIASTPFMDVIKLQMDAYLTDLRLRAQFAGDNEAMERMKWGVAFQTWSATNGAASPQAVYNFMHEGGQAIAAGLMDQPEASLTPPQRELVNINKALAAKQAALNTELRLQIFQKFNNALTNYRLTAGNKGVTPGQLEGAATAINTTLIEAGAPFSASYGPVEQKGIRRLVPGAAKDIVFKDAKGNYVDLSTVQQFFNTPAAVTPTRTTRQLNLEAMKADYDRLSPGERTVWLEQAKGQLTPEEYAQLRTALGVK